MGPVIDSGDFVIPSLGSTVDCFAFSETVAPVGSTVAPVAPVAPVPTNEVFSTSASVVGDGGEVEDVDSRSDSVTLFPSSVTSVVSVASSAFRRMVSTTGSPVTPVPSTFSVPFDGVVELIKVSIDAELSVVVEICSVVVWLSITSVPLSVVSAIFEVSEVVFISVAASDGVVPSWIVATVALSTLTSTKSC